MNINDFIKILKRASEVQIDYKKDQNNGFVAKIKGIINTMDNKKKRITINDVVNRLDRLENIVTNLALEMREGFKQVNARLDNLESEARKHGWNV